MLSKSLKTNSTLTSLDLSLIQPWGRLIMRMELNEESAKQRLTGDDFTIGPEGGEKLGEALKTNRTLTELNLACTIVSQRDI